MSNYPTKLRHPIVQRSRFALTAIALGAGLALVCFVAFFASQTLGQTAPPSPSKPVLAVTDWKGLGASEAEISAVTDRLREVLLQSGKATVVERDRMNELMAGQANAQAACTGPQCGSAGKLLGVRYIVSGKVLKFGPDTWQVSATLVDVESAQTLKAETVRQKGDMASLLDRGIAELGTKIAAGLPAGG
jgi:TolB-like protein